MSATYLKRFEAMFLCSHPRGPKISTAAVAKYLRKSSQFEQKCAMKKLKLSSTCLNVV